MKCENVKHSYVRTRLRLATFVRVAVASLVISAALFTNSMAGLVEITCELPTQNTDGSPLTNLDDIHIYGSRVAGGPYTELANGPDCVFNLELENGVWFFVATAKNTDEVYSAYSAEVSHTVASLPEPPTNIVVNGNLVAYSISITKDIFLTYPVGTVPAGTPCEGDMNANGLYLVPVSAVVFAGGADATVAFAECGAG